MTEQLKRCNPQGHGLSQEYTSMYVYVCINTLHKGDDDDDDNNNNNNNNKQ